MKWITSLRINCAYHKLQRLNGALKREFDSLEKQFKAELTNNQRVIYEKMATDLNAILEAVPDTSKQGPLTINHVNKFVKNLSTMTLDFIKVKSPKDIVSLLAMVKNIQKGVIAPGLTALMLLPLLSDAVAGLSKSWEESFGKEPKAIREARTKFYEKNSARLLSIKAKFLDTHAAIGLLLKRCPHHRLHLDPEWRELSQILK